VFPEAQRKHGSARSLGTVGKAFGYLRAYPRCEQAKAHQSEAWKLHVGIVIDPDSRWPQPPTHPSPVADPLRRHTSLESCYIPEGALRIASTVLGHGSRRYQCGLLESGARGPMSWLGWFLRRPHHKHAVVDTVADVVCTYPGIERQA
jgi:hypothetical protein